jgi:hypothetical protein
MKNRYFLIMSAVLAISAVSAFADDGGKDGGKDGGQGALQARSISFAEFKDRCANPDKYRGDVQRAPENIKVQCTDVTRVFVADASGQMPLPGSRNVVTALFSDKFNVDADTKAYAMDTKGGSCLPYKEVQNTLSVEKQLSCGEILSWKGDVEDFCEQNLDNLKGANPKLIDVKETGAVIDTCGGASVQGGKDPGK